MTRDARRRAAGVCGALYVAACCVLLRTSVAFAPIDHHKQRYVVAGNIAESHHHTTFRRQRPPPPPRRVLFLANKDGNNQNRNESHNNNKKEDPSNNLDRDAQDNNRDFEKAVRVARVKAEIDRILKGPDAPFDAEEEFKKVESISPGLKEGSEEEQMEQVLSEIEAELYTAVNQEDFVVAKSKKEEISKMHVDDCGAVLQVNSAFYKAFSNKDFEAMERIWLHDAGVVCIHPSHAPLVGVNAVLKSWKNMFETTSGSFQSNWMEPSNIKLVVKGTTAILACDEDVFARRFVRGQKRQTERLNKLTATNIFRKVNGRWYMAHHHGSWHAESDAAKLALNGGSDNVKSRGVFRGRNKSGNAQGQMLSDGILGNFGPYLGDDDSKKEDGKPVKRVILGSLDDILKGGLGDILNDAQDGEEGGKAIIHFSQVEAGDEEEVDDEEGEESDEEEEVDDEEVDGEVETISIVHEWANKSQDDDSQSASRKLTMSQSGSGNAPKDALRQNCISALRKLCNQGSISPKQKRVLLTDIITCSAKGEFSMVEVAYELLCGEGEDKDAAEIEFADQCRVFAHSLPDSPPSSESPS